MIFYHRLWKIVYQIHVGWSEESIENSEKLSAEKASYSDWAELVSHSDTRGQFHDRLVKIEENEALYLLTALANMAVERESTESHFVEVRKEVWIFLSFSILSSIIFSIG